MNRAQEWKVIEVIKVSLNRIKQIIFCFFFFNVQPKKKISFEWFPSRWFMMLKFYKTCAFFVWFESKKMRLSIAKTLFKTIFISIGPNSIEFKPFYISNRYLTSIEIYSIISFFSTLMQISDHLMPFIKSNLILHLRILFAFQHLHKFYSINFPSFVWLFFSLLKCSYF